MLGVLLHSLLLLPLFFNSTSLPVYPQPCQTGRSVIEVDENLVCLDRAPAFEIGLFFLT